MMIPYVGESFRTHEDRWEWGKLVTEGEGRQRRQGSCPSLALTDGVEGVEVMPTSSKTNMMMQHGLE